MADASKSDRTRRVCGIVMPISAIDGCTETHWADVQEILSESIEDAGFEANLVSNADDVGVIQKRIIQNLYDNEIVVCDVSGKNPNVMFELGIRLAFDKPTIIVKDDKTSYSFDTSAIEHLEYPRDLRFTKIVEFKDKLSDKVRATAERAAKDPEYTTFLKHFGDFTAVKIDKKEVTAQEFVLDEIRAMRAEIRSLQSVRTTPAVKPVRSSENLCARGASEDSINEAREFLTTHPKVLKSSIDEAGPNHKHIRFTAKTGEEDELPRIRQEVRRIIGPPKPIARSGTKERT